MIASHSNAPTASLYGISCFAGVPSFDSLFGFVGDFAGTTFSQLNRTSNSFVYDCWCNRRFPSAVYSNSTPRNFSGLPRSLIGVPSIVLLSPYLTQVEFPKNTKYHRHDTTKHSESVPYDLFVCKGRDRPVVVYMPIWTKLSPSVYAKGSWIDTIHIRCGSIKAVSYTHLTLPTICSV